MRSACLDIRRGRFLGPALHEYMEILLHFFRKAEKVIGPYTQMFVVETAGSLYDPMILGDLRRFRKDRLKEQSARRLIECGRPPSKLCSLAKKTN